MHVCMVSTQHASQATTGMYIQQNCSSSTSCGSGNDAFTSGGSGSDAFTSGGSGSDVFSLYGISHFVLIHQMQSFNNHV